MAIGMDFASKGMKHSAPINRRPTRPAAGVRKTNRAPVIKPRSFPCHTQAVLQHIQADELAFKEAVDFGWKVLQQQWNVNPDNVDTGALSYLRSKPSHLQQHVLLVLATTKLGNVKNLSAFLTTLILEMETAPPVCLGFLAGCCSEPGECLFSHPEFTNGWKVLWRRWKVSWQDFDYLVLNSLFQRTCAEQEEILKHLATMKLTEVHNLSALLSSVIERSTGAPSFSMGKGRRPQQWNMPPVEPATLPCREFSPRPIPISEGSISIASTTSRSDSDVVTSEAETVSQCGSPTNKLMNSFHESWASIDSKTLSWADALEEELEAGLLPEYEPPAYMEPSSQTQSPAKSEEKLVASSSSPKKSASRRLALTPAPAPVQAPASKFPFIPAVLGVLQSVAAPPPTAGWEALRSLWNISFYHFDEVLLHSLAMASPVVQDQLLLTLAAMNLSEVEDLNAELCALLYNTTQPLCWRFLLGSCPTGQPCAFHHVGLPQAPSHPWWVSTPSAN